MKYTENICNDLKCTTELTRITAMSESEGRNYTNEEVTSSFHSTWQQLEHICNDLEHVIYDKTNSSQF